MTSPALQPADVPRPDPTDAAALAAREAALAAAGDDAGRYMLLLEAAGAHPTADGGAELALKAAAVAQEALADTSLERSALLVALDRNPSAVEAVIALCDLDRAEGAFSDLAADLERLAALDADPVERAAYLAQSAEIRSQLGDPMAPATWRAALRAIPPASAAGVEAAAPLRQGDRTARIEGLLNGELAAAEDPVSEAEAHLALGRLLVGDPSRRDAAVGHLLRAAALADGPGAVALDVLGGLHTLGEGWSDLVGRLEREASERTPDDPGTAIAVLRRLARACLTEPPVLDRAEEALRRLLALVPEDVGTAEALVGVLTAQRRHRDAAALLEDLARVTEEATAALYLVRAGVVHLARFGDQAKSLSCFEAALAAHPGYRPAATHLREAYREAGRWADLARVMVAEVEGREVDKAVLDTWREAGRILRDQAGDLVAAATVYRRIVAHDPMDADAVAFFEGFHERVDAEADAVAAHAREAQAAPSPEARRAALLLAADAAERLGSPPRTRAFLREALAADPRDRAVETRYLDLLARIGEPGAYAEALAEARVRAEDDPAHHGALGLKLAAVRLDRLGDVAGAREILAEVAASDGPEAVTARTRLGALEAAVTAAEGYAGGIPGPHLVGRTVTWRPGDGSWAEAVDTGQAPSGAFEGDAPPAGDRAPGEGTETDVPVAAADGASAPAAGEGDGEAVALPAGDREVPIASDAGSDGGDAAEADGAAEDGAATDGAAADGAAADGAAADGAGRLTEARRRLDAGDFEGALDLADEAASSGPEAVATEARELAADILLDYLGDTDEGLDRLATLGRDRSLPLSLRRRVNEARVRLLERDVGAGAARDQALALALADAAAVAEDPVAARALRYREGRLLASRHDTWRAGADRFEALLVDEPENRAILDGLAGVYEREEAWGPLAEVLERLAECMESEAAVEAYGRLADVALDGLEDPAGALRALRRALDRLPGHLPTLKTLARVAREADDRATEAFALRGCIAAETDHEALPGLHYALAEALEADGRYEEATTHYTQVLDADPGSRAARVALARLATELEDPADRVRVLARCADGADAAEAAELHVARARILFDDLGDRDGARAAAKAALEIDGEHLGALTYLRELAERTGAPAKEIASMIHREQWVARSPKDAADRHADLAALYLEPLGDPAAGEAHLREALAADPEHPRSLISLARRHLERDEVEAAAPLLDRLAASESAPTEVRAWALAEAAGLQEADGAYPEGLERYQAAVDLDPESPPALLGVARLATKLGRDKEAIEALTHVARLGEAGVAGAPSGAELADVQARLGALHRRQGNTLEAVKAYRRALDRDAVHREALHALAVLYEEQGEWSAAAQMREGAARLVGDRRLRAEALASVGGFVRDRVGDTRRALDAFRQAAALDPETLSYHASVLALARRVGRPDEARAAAMECVRLAPDGVAAAEYLAAAADCADAEHDLEGALDLARVALERDPACDGALARAIPALTARGEIDEAAERLARAIDAARDDGARLRYTLDRARVLQDGGDPLAASGALAQAAALTPDDTALLVALADFPPPPPEAARPALDAVAAAARRRRLEVPPLAAVEILAAGAGDPDRAYLAAALLDLMRTGTRMGTRRLADVRAELPDVPTGTLPKRLAEALVPAEVRAGETFYAAAEMALLSVPAADRRLLFATEGGELPDANLAAILETVAGALSRPVPRLRIDVDGTGVRVAPDTGTLLVARDLLENRLPGEVRFALAFGVVLAAPGHRWVTAGGDAEAPLEALRRWALHRAGADDALDFGVRFGAGIRERLEAVVSEAVPEAADFLDAAVAEAARFGLLVAGDLLQGLAAALRILAPGSALPRSPEAVAALAEESPTLADVFGLVHDDAFLAGRLALGLALEATAG